MSLALPRNSMAEEYLGIYPDNSAAVCITEPTKRRLERAQELVGQPELLAQRFRESVDQNITFFSGLDPSREREPEPFFDKVRDPSSRKQVYEPGLSNTPEVGELMAAQGNRCWEVLGAADLSFYYVEGELLLTQAKGLRLDPEVDSIGLRIDLLLASARGGVPIIGEVKVTQESGAPDEDPFYALIQALACATYLVPPQQLARLHRHDRRNRLNTDSQRLDVYVVTVREPPASKPWFELRDAAERLSGKVIPEIAEWIRTIAFVELAWLDRPSRESKRPPRVTKRYAVGD